MTKTIMDYIKAHRIRVGVIFFIFVLFIIFAGIPYFNFLKVQHILDNDVPAMHQKYFAAFPNRRVLDERSNRTCHDASKYSVDIWCDRSYAYETAATGDRTHDEQALRDFYDLLMADGWTGGSQPQLNYTLPATTGHELKASESGVLNISVWRSPGAGVECDINASFVPFIPRLRNVGGGYYYSLYCRKVVFSLEY